MNRGTPGDSSFRLQSIDYSSEKLPLLSSGESRSQLNKDECLERVIYDTAIYEFGYEEGNEMVFITGGFDFVGFPKAWFTTINSFGAGARVEFFLDGDEVVYPYRKVRI